MDSKYVICPVDGDEEDALDAYQGLWRNLWFLKSGESDFGRPTYSCRHDAAHASRMLLVLTHQSMREPDFSAKLGRDVLWSEISHAIPMPVTK